MNQLKSMASVNKKPSLKEVREGQFQYLGRWVDKSTFRAFVYGKNGESLLANSYEDFERLISSGLWFASKVHSSKDRKQKDAVCSNS